MPISVHDRLLRELLFPDSMSSVTCLVSVLRSVVSVSGLVLWLKKIMACVLSSGTINQNVLNDSNERQSRLQFWAV